MRQCDDEGVAVGAHLQRDVAAQSARGAPRHRQAQPHTFVTARQIIFDLPEVVEDQFAFVGRDRRGAVLDRQRDGIPFGRCRHCHASALRRELDGVGEQVARDDDQTFAVVLNRCNVRRNFDHGFDGLGLKRRS